MFWDAHNRCRVWRTVLWSSVATCEIMLTCYLFWVISVILYPLVTCVGRSTHILVDIVLLWKLWFIEKSFGKLMSNKQRNDMQKSVHIASMTYRLHIGIHCHSVVFLHMGMLCTSCLNIMGDYLPYCCNNPYTQKKALWGLLDNLLCRK